MSQDVYFDDLDPSEPIGVEGDLSSWVQDKLDEWERYYDSNYRDKDDEYYRIWRGIWAKEDKERESERSRIISPNSQQAVESSVAEVEEATFGRGDFFRIDDDVRDEDKQDIAKLEALLKEEFKKNKIRKEVAEVVVNAAVFGYGAAEVVVTEVEDRTPGIRPALDGQLVSIGAQTKTKTCVKLVPIATRSLRFDPSAPSIEEGLGVGYERFVSRHSVELLQESGVYKDGYLGDAAPDQGIEEDKELLQYAEGGRIKLQKYFGLVPRALLEKANNEAEDDEDLVYLMPVEEGEESMYVEAIVVLGNGVLLMAEENPYLMQDRPLIGFAWDIVPGMLRGRGVVEKGYNTQKAIDAEMRSRIDGLALTTHPMLAMDARRLPRNGDFRVRPGKTILTQGDPREILHSFNFGEMSQNTFAQTAALEKMHQSATGAVDSTGISGGINGEATAAGISMSLGAVIKRHKRTLLNFQECFLIPFVEKAAWRYMQFDPERFPVGDYNFITTTALGIMAREYEVTQLVQLLQTVSPESPLYTPLLTQVIDNMNITERKQLVAQLEAAGKPTPEQEEEQKALKEKQEKQADERFTTEMSVLSGQANEFNSRANKYNKEAELLPVQAEIDMMNAVEDVESKDFNKNLELADRRLKEKGLNIQNNNKTRGN